MAFAIGLLLLTAHLYADIQTQLDATYTTHSSNKKVFSKSVAKLSNEAQDTFMLGKSFFTVPWVEAPSATTARDGLGPLFNANTCISCHPKHGRASVYTKKGSISRGYVTRLSIPSDGSKEHQEMQKYAGFVQEPNYGAQISINGVHGVPYEAKPKITYHTVVVQYPDGNTKTLSKPLQGKAQQLQDLQYGVLHPNTSITNRLAPALIGLGLLEQISDAQILAHEDIEDTDKDGISGKANRVYSIEHQEIRIGRYTYKASAPSVLHQSAAAASNDMSLTNPLFPEENCTAKQKECLEAPKGEKVLGKESFDLPQKRLEAIAFYLQNLRIPKSSITQKKGEKHFDALGCVKCHTPAFTLENGYKVKAFTDLLLHDMGEELSDNRVEFQAQKQEWRTAPLWGIGKYILTSKQKPELLHDGRAKSIEEAILWHDGEAQASKNNFMHLSKKQRQELIDYIKEL